MSITSDKVELINKCRICEKDDFTQVINIGSLALTGVFPQADKPDPLSSELNLVLCKNCYFLQLDRTIDSDEMYSSYWYRSGVNKSMRDHLLSIVNKVNSLVELHDEDICVDIGCNDGTLLKSYKQSTQANVKRVGYDPSDAIKDINDDSIVAINNYFNAQQYKENFGSDKAKVITSISMFYDLDNPHAFIKDIKECLDKKGLWVLEVNYTSKMLTDLGFDMISHEHVSYYTLNTLKRLLNMHDLYINDVSFNDMNGGNVCLYVGFENKQSKLVEESLKSEIDLGVETESLYESFATRVSLFKDKFTSYINSKEEGFKVCGYGASTRGNTILQYCQVTEKQMYAIADRNPIKHGLVTSGGRIPIISEKEMRQDHPDYLISLPYYFNDEFVNREMDYLKKGGVFVFLLPNLYEVRWNQSKGEIETTIIEEYNR